MAVSAPARRKPTERRTQRERREHTRARLLDATLECLAELGWTGTSTTEVARRAGVSRGAQQHHYRTKHELVAASLDHILERHRAEYEQRFALLPEEKHNAEGAIELLWEIYQGRTFTALIELTMAARTDEALRRLCADVNERIATYTIEVFDEIFPKAPGREIMPAVLRGLLALLTGLALQQSLDDDPAGHRAEVLAQLKIIGRLLVPDEAVRIDEVR